MQILYVHHADRDRSNKNIDRQLQDITENGIQDANLLAEKLKELNVNITTIYTSQYLRCKHTTEIINKYHNAPVIEEPRFNEMNNAETWKEFSLRNMEGIKCKAENIKQDDKSKQNSISFKIKIINHISYFIFTKASFRYSI